MKQTKTPTPKPLSLEERQAQARQFFAQKKEQYFQGCLFSLLSNPAICKDDTFQSTILDMADALADKALEKLYKPKFEEK